MVLQIHEARRQAKEDHKTNLLELARQGDRRVIGYLKRSSSASATDAGFLQRAGGSLQAQAAMSEHYRTKYTTDDPTPIDPAIQSLFAYHCQGTLVSITCEEIMRHLNKLDARTCTGEDGVPYSLLKSVLRTDLRESSSTIYFVEVRSPMNGNVAGLVLFLRLNFLRNLQISDLSV